MAELGVLLRRWQHENVLDVQDLFPLLAFSIIALHARPGLPWTVCKFEPPFSLCVPVIKGSVWIEHELPSAGKYSAVEVELLLGMPIIVIM